MTSENKARNFDFKKLTLFIEGSTGKNFVQNWLKSVDSELEQKCDIHAFQAAKDKGFKNIEFAISTWKNQAEDKAEPLGCALIIIDAEDDANKTKLTLDKIIAENTNIEYLIVPLSGQNALESALLSSVKESSSDIKTCATAFAECVQLKNPKHEKFAKQNWLHKVTVHAMLAATATPESSLWGEDGLHLWDENAPELKRIIDAIRSGVDKLTSQLTTTV